MKTLSGPISNNRGSLFWAVIVVPQWANQGNSKCYGMWRRDRFSQVFIYLFILIQNLEKSNEWSECSEAELMSSPSVSDASVSKRCTNRSFSDSVTSASEAFFFFFFLQTVWKIQVLRNLLIFMHICFSLCFWFDSMQYAFQLNKRCIFTLGTRCSCFFGFFFNTMRPAFLFFCHCWL